MPRFYDPVMDQEARSAVLKKFGVRLAMLRKSKNLSQEELAHQSGVARSYLSGVERGKRNTALAHICLLAETLGVRPYLLLDFDGELDVATVGQASQPDSDAV